MNTHILPEAQKKLWQELIKHAETINAFDFYLAGGTALALQTSHRQSVDFDFFSQRKDFVPKILEWIEKYFPNVIERDRGEYTVHVEINGVKLSFIGGYKYSTIDALVQDNGLRLASIKEIGVMKLLALINRSSIRDYVDMALILRDHFCLKDLIGSARVKYGVHFNALLLLRALTSFQDLDEDMPLIYDKDLQKSWKTILENAVRDMAL